MTKVKEKMLENISATKIIETDNKKFLSASEKVKVSMSPIGSNIYNGIAGRLIEHNLNISVPYNVAITNTSQPNGLGDVFVVDKTENSFLVKNTGTDTQTTFDWSIIY